MKMLYVGCGHFLQSTDDCLMWAKLGIEWYDTSYYYLNNFSDCGFIEPYYSGKDFYQALQKQNHQRICDNDILNKKDKQFSGQVAQNSWQFSKDFISQFDIVFFNHLIPNVLNNLKVLKNKKVILKTFGMHPLSWEQEIKKVRQQGVYIVRNNPTEYLRCQLLASSQTFSYNRLSGQSKMGFAKKDIYGGHDAIIRGCPIRDEEEVSGWNGNKKEVVTFSSIFNYDDASCQRRRNLYTEIRNGLPQYRFRLFGSCNDNEPMSEGFISHKEKIEILRNARVALVVGTPNSSNTYSLVEALVMGIPIVVFNKNMWNSDIYEIDQIIKDGVNGYICEDCNDAKQKIDLLMRNKGLAKQISEAGRKRGIELYGRENRAKDWQKFLFEDIWKDRSREQLKDTRGEDVCSFNGGQAKHGTSAIVGMGR